MANSYHQVYLQIIFVVKYRNAIIERSWSDRLHAIIGNLIKETGCKAILVNGVEDHIHCLISLLPAISISDLMRSVKSKSSKYINDHSLTSSHFEWQEGYGVFSYGQSQTEAVYTYIEQQETHHKNLSFRDEYIGFLKNFHIKYEEKYIFQELI